jgi:hypothetical protein
MEMLDQIKANLERKQQQQVLDQKEASLLKKLAKIVLVTATFANSDGPLESDFTNPRSAVLFRLLHAHFVRKAKRVSNIFNVLTL